MMYGDGSSTFHGVFAVKVRGTFTLVRLRTALARVQAKHSLLGAGIQEDDKGLPYFIFGKQTVPPIPVRIAGRHSDTDWMEETKSEWARPFDLNTGPLLRLVWLRGEETGELIMSFHHCLCDGGSASAILNDLLNLLDQPGLIIGQTPVFHSLADLIPSPIFNHKKDKLKAWANSAFLGLALSAASLFIGTKNKKRISREKDYLLHWKLTEEESDVLFKRCKTSGITVNTILALVFLKAFQQVKGAGFHNKVMCPVDIRKFVPAVKKDTLFAFGLSITLSMDRRKPEKDFWEMASFLQEEGTKKMTKLNAYPVLMAMEYAHSSLKKLIRLLTYGKPGNDFMFSNMGRLDLPECCGNLTIETVYSPTVIGPFANPTTIIASTFRGRLDFSFVSNEQFMENKDAMAIKYWAMELLQQNVPGQ
ncbi:condensation domain-containing protein [Flavitalea flava]